MKNTKVRTNFNTSHRQNKTEEETKTSSRPPSVPFKQTPKTEEVDDIDDTESFKLYFRLNKCAIFSK